MKVEVEIPDAVLEDAIQARVKAQLNPSGDRAILISPEYRRQLEEVFQTTVTDATDLVRRTRGLCTYSIQDVPVRFTPDELARIDMQAKFHGRTRQVFIAEMVAEIKARMLEQV